MTTVVLDNEPVQALLSVDHPKHRRALALVEASLGRGRRRRYAIVVPTSVRVEACWKRTDPGAAAINRLRVEDHALDRAVSDTAVAIRIALDVSIPDAHLGAVLADRPGPVAVITSDVEDVRRMAGYVGAAATVVRL